MQTEQTLYWHDYETWGLSPSLDRPSQFAGIRTDMDFNIISEPDMFYCRLSDDYLPSAESALITGITPQITQSQGVCEAEFSSRINQQFTQINTCVVGYNTIRFDEEFSRNIFYRNFFDPYEYSWKNGNSRWDIIDLVRAAYALRPEGINWPKNEQGLPSFRLELLTEANNISHEMAHDATSDVYATIAMAKLIKQKAPKLFDYYFNLRNKNKVKELIDTQQHTPLIHVSGMFGAAKGNTSLIAPIVWHPINSNAVAVVDLSQDLSPLLELSADEIRQRLYTKKDELGDNLPIPIKLVHINKCPFLAIEKALLAENSTRLGIDRNACFENLEKLKVNKNIPQVISKVFQQETTFDNKGNVDAMLYDGFFSDKDKRVFEEIRKTLPEQLASKEFQVSDKRFESLFFNYRARNYPRFLSKTEKTKWNSHRKKTLSPKLADYFSNLDMLVEQYKDDTKNSPIIQSLYQYVEKITDSLD
ncbi:MAG: exodeoxyribonuclease I [Methylococcaceae bacterium]|nr:exodeoxyribonuclease I [Methylococcaceae bacterium]